ncbi:hypothetical protein NDU88_000607 [Pleurodeles waltl]|uniref:Uncharacterized protein n=1 Tax=Pleurodeles waltl TaxID=8319 RepID=A0AAV7Q7G3_PLEWA|nr:hypothetical protein NDU88_000607 [Pleurodeles waltl]
MLPLPQQSIRGKVPTSGCQVRCPYKAAAYNGLNVLWALTGTHSKGDDTLAAQTGAVGDALGPEVMCRGSHNHTMWFSGSTQDHSPGLLAPEWGTFSARHNGLPLQRGPGQGWCWHAGGLGDLVPSSKSPTLTWAEPAPWTRPLRGARAEHSLPVPSEVVRGIRGLQSAEGDEAAPGDRFVLTALQLLGPESSRVQGVDMFLKALA